METKILEQKDNSVVKRKEIRFEVVYEQAPPKRGDVLKSVSDNAKTKQEFTIIRKMNNVYGLRKIVGIAHAYENEETLKKFETKNIIKRNQGAKKEEPKAEAPVAAPVEEKKEEPKTEEAPKEEPKVEEKPAEEKKEGEA